SRDGLECTTFHQKCDGINKTLLVAKTQNSDQIFGGYNPLNWNGHGFKYTTESFIFNISNRKDINTAKFSYVIDNYPNAIYCSPSSLPLFGIGSDLGLFVNGSIWSKPITYNNINLVHGSI